jgi:hypothetical protein
MEAISRGPAMRRIHALLAALCLAAALPVAAAADSAEIDLDKDRFVAGGSVRQVKPVDGDLFSFGGEVDLHANVSGDAVLGGGDVRVRDRVTQDLYAGGGNVRVEAPVGRNARLAGGNVEIASTASIGGNLSIGGGSIEVRGPVGGYLQVAGGDVLIDAAIAGDVRVAAGELQLGPNARIGGKLVHHGAKVRQDPAAQVAGGIERAPAARTGQQERASLHRRGIGGWIWSLGLIGLAGLIAAVFPAGSRAIGAGLREDPAIGLLLGFIALVCVPIAAVVLAVTIIGIPLALAVLLLYFLMLIVGYAAVGVVIGDAALAQLRSQDAQRIGWRVGAAMTAMLALALLTRVPYLGGLVAFVALLAGVGAIVLALKSRANRRAAAAA